MTTLATTTTLTVNKRTIMDGNATLHASKRLATIVAVLALTFWLSSTHSQAAGVWTNEPAGANVILDCPFNSVSGCGILDVYSSNKISSDASAPISSSSVVQSTIYAGNSTGGMQLNYSTPQVTREIYVGVMWRTNPQFQGRQVGNKMFFVRGPSVNGVFLFGAGSLNGGQAPMIFNVNTGGYDNSHITGGDPLAPFFPNAGPGLLTVGTWTKLEAYIKGSTTATSRDGIVRWWVNGALAGNYTNVNYAPNGLNEWVWSETWDGTVNPVPTVDWSHYIDHMHISIPGGGSSSDQPPGPPATPRLLGVTTP